MKNGIERISKYSVFPAFIHIPSDKPFHVSEVIQIVNKHLDKHLNINNSRTTLNKALVKAVEIGFLDKIYNIGWYKRTLMTNEEFLNSIVNIREKLQQNCREANKIDLKTDDVCLAILDILKKYSPISVRSNTIVQELSCKCAESTVKSRLRLMYKEKLLARFGRDAQITYKIYEEVHDFTSTDLQQFILSYKKLQSQNSLLFAAFIKMGQKLKDGEDVRPTLMKMCEKVEELSKEI